MKGHVARKRFGQNFLVDHGIIAAIISALIQNAMKPWSKSAPVWGRSPNR